MITRLPRSSFSANINNTAQTNEHQTLSELFYKELEDKFSGKELATPLLKSFSENCRQNGRHIFSNKDFVIKISIRYFSNIGAMVLNHYHDPRVAELADIVIPGALPNTS